MREGNSRLLGGLRYKKIRRYNNSAPYMMVRWLPQQIPPLNFLDFNNPILTAVLETFAVLKALYCFLHFEINNYLTLK